MQGFPASVSLPTSSPACGFVAAARNRAFPLLPTLVGALLLNCLPVSVQALPAGSPNPPNHLQAHLTLRPLEVVNLGAGRPSGFLLRAHNVGGRCVALFERTAAGDTLSRGLLGPGATVTLTLAPGAGVFVQNPPKRRFVRQPLWRRATFEFEVINGTDDGLRT